MNKSLLVVVVVLSLACGAAMAQILPQKVVVYYLPWEMESIRRLSPEDLRQTAPVVVTIRGPLGQMSKVRHWLDVLAMKPRDSEPEDARLVVDFFEGDQKTESYYASNFNLLSEDSKRGRPIDEAFRSHFRFLEER